MNTDIKAKIDTSTTASLIKRGQLDVLLLEHALFTAEIALQGAQILSFTPQGQSNWLWLSPLASFESNKAIRGGIPICLPWFGVNTLNPEKPKHGFARNSLWQLTELKENSEGCCIHFTFNYDGHETSLYEHAFCANLSVSLSHEIHVQLEIGNLSDRDMPLSFAFHSYFAIDDLNSVEVLGLEQKKYLDNTEGLVEKLQQQALSFEGEVDRVYENIDSIQTIKQNQRFNIAANHCPSCIVWNPGSTLADNITDIQEYFNDFICVERGAAFSDRLNITPQQTQTFSMKISN